MFYNKIQDILDDSNYYIFYAIDFSDLKYYKEYNDLPLKTKLEIYLLIFIILTTIMIMYII